MTSKELVQIIEAELLKQGISKGEFYKACNISSGHMTNWRKEKNFPQTPTLVKISEYLGLDLLGAKTKKPASVSADGVKINPHYFDLSEEDRAVVDAMIERLSKASQ